MSALMKCRAVEMKFGGIVAIAGLDLDVQRDEVLGVIGPNGAGKSTLINILTGFLRPTAGQITLDDKALEHKSSRIARAGVRRTFQAARPFPSLSLEQNVRLGAEGSGDRAAADRWTLKLLDWIGLAPETSPNVLSAGQLRLVAVARAAVSEPRVLLLDEPAAGLSDPEVAAMGEMLGRLRDAMGTTVVIVEHNMDFIFRHCTRIVTLDHGSLIASGTPDEIRNNERVIDAYLGRPR